MQTNKLARVSLTLLKAFDAAARHLSFSRAAIDLGRSQATLSVQVRELERQLDIPLFDRTTRRVALTAAGEALAHGLREGFAAIAAGLEAATDLAHARSGRLTIACVPSLSGSRLPAILAKFRERDSVTEIDVQELTYVDMVKAIEQGSVDFGIGPCSDPPPPTVTFNIAANDLLCVLLPAAQNPHLEVMPLEMLASWPLIFLSRSTPLDRSLKEVAEGQGIKLNVNTKVRHIYTAIGLVRAGVGAAIVPRLALPDIEDPELLAVPIAGHPLERKIGILSFRGRALQPIAAKLARYVATSLRKASVPSISRVQAEIVSQDLLSGQGLTQPQIAVHRMRSGLLLR